VKTYTRLNNLRVAGRDLMFRLAPSLKQSPTGQIPRPRLGPPAWFFLPGSNPCSPNIGVAVSNMKKIGLETIAKPVRRTPGSMTPVLIRKPDGDPRTKGQYLVRSEVLNGPFVVIRRRSRGGAKAS